MPSSKEHNEMKRNINSRCKPRQFKTMECVQTSLLIQTLVDAICNCRYIGHYSNIDSSAHKVLTTRNFGKLIFW